MGNAKRFRRRQRHQFMRIELHGGRMKKFDRVTTAGSWLVGGEKGEDFFQHRKPASIKKNEYDINNEKHKATLASSQCFTIRISRNSYSILFSTAHIHYFSNYNFPDFRPLLLPTRVVSWSLFPTAIHCVWS